MYRVQNEVWIHSNNWKLKLWNKYLHTEKGICISKLLPVSPVFQAINFSVDFSSIQSEKKRLHLSLLKLKEKLILLLPLVTIYCSFIGANKFLINFSSISWYEHIFRVLLIHKLCFMFHIRVFSFMHYINTLSWGHSISA